MLTFSYLLSYLAAKAKAPEQSPWRVFDADNPLKALLGGGKEGGDE